MKKLDKMNRIIGYLNKLFTLCNDHFFDGQLEMPVITCTPTETAYGHLSASKIWTKEDGTSQYELNISSYYLNKDICGSRDCVQICVTMLHEMVHLALIQGIDDNAPDETGGTSNRGIYHNKSFRNMAEKRAKLVISRSEKYGYTISEASEEIISFIIDSGIEELFLINRDGGYTYKPTTGGTTTGTPKITPTKTKSNSRKWVCPGCGQIIRSTRDDTNVICGDCNEKFVRA